MSYGMDLIKQAERAMNSGDLDTAESLVNKALRGALKNSSNNSADDEDNDFDSPSATSMNDDGSYDDTDDDSEDDDEELDKAIRKVSALGEAYLDSGNGHRNMSASVSRIHAPHPLATDATSATGLRGRHKFDAMVDHVKERDGVSRNEAMTRARQEFPRVYQSFQEHLVNEDTASQHLSRGGGRNQVGKRADGITFESMVDAEMRKGCNYEIAAQRVCQQHGFRALDNRSSMAKAATTITDTWDDLVLKTATELDCTMNEAQRVVREENPSLFKALQVI
jgi:hypothetical protein